MSSLVRLPIYTITLGLQTVKMFAKILVSPITHSFAWMLNTKELNSWKFSGIAKDGITVLNILDRIGSSSLGVITAPPKKNHSLLESFTPLKAFVFLGVHHGTSQDDLLLSLKTHRAAYSRVIFDHDEPLYTTRIPKYYQKEQTAYWQSFNEVKAG